LVKYNKDIFRSYSNFNSLKGMSEVGLFFEKVLGGKDSNGSKYESLEDCKLLGRVVVGLGMILSFPSLKATTSCRLEDSLEIFVMRKRVAI
jgi:hypothetical protein